MSEQILCSFLECISLDQRAKRAHCNLLYVALSRNAWNVQSSRCILMRCNPQTNPGSNHGQTKFNIALIEFCVLDVILKYFMLVVKRTTYRSCQCLLVEHVLSLVFIWSTLESASLMVLLSSFGYISIALSLPPNLRLNRSGEYRIGYEFH